MTKHDLIYQVPMIVAIIGIFAWAHTVVVKAILADRKAQPVEVRVVNVPCEHAEIVTNYPVFTYNDYGEDIFNTLPYTNANAFPTMCITNADTFPTTPINTY